MADEIIKGRVTGIGFISVGRGDYSLSSEPSAQFLTVCIGLTRPMGSNGTMTERVALDQQTVKPFVEEGKPLPREGDTVEVALSDKGVVRSSASGMRVATSFHQANA